MIPRVDTDKSGKTFQENPEVDIKSAFQLARPKHWVKNVVVLFPVILAMRIYEVDAWRDTILTMLAFCFACSACYIFNDILDRKKDQAHPQKKNRPLAAGRVTVGAAGVECLFCLVGAGAIAIAVNIPVAVVLIAYVLLQLAYTLKLKNLMLLDVICIAIGFVLRAVAGAVAIPVAISPWLFICTFTICLFMGFCKRRSELSTIIDGKASEHRTVLGGYTPELLTHLITVSAGVAIIGFLLYATSPRTIGNFGTNYMIYTLPVMVYAVFRFSMLSIKASYMDPTELILRDRAFQFAVIIWAAMMVGVVFWGHDLQIWISNCVK